MIALGVSAQALHHLNYLIAEPIQAAVLYRSGVLVQIPRPERYAIGAQKGAPLSINNKALSVT